MIKLLKILANLNVILALVGYPFVTNVFADFMLSSSQIVTIPYRAFTLGVALITILCSTLVNKQLKINKIVAVLFIYWILLFIRFEFDLQFRPELDLNLTRANQIFLYMVGLAIVPMIAVVRTHKLLDFNKLLIWSYLISSISLLLTFNNNDALQEASTERVWANIALNTISTGHLGLTNIILGGVILLKHNLKLIYKGLIILIGIIGFLTLLRAGSRGPVLALLLVVSFYIFSSSKYSFGGLILIIILISGVYLFLDNIIDWIGDISPILKSRLFDRVDATSDREPLYNEALRVFYENPFIGRDFALYKYGSSFMYPHNLFLESLMQLGIVGCSLLVYILYKTFKKGYQLIHTHSSSFWIVLLFVQEFSSLLVSGTFSMNPTFSILIILIALSINSIKLKPI